MMQNFHHQEKIKQIIADCSRVDKYLINDHSWLDTDLYIDSLILTEIIYALEEMFPICIAQSDIVGINQVIDVYRLVAHKLGEDNRRSS